MQYLGIEFAMQHPPKLDPTFIPFGVYRIILGAILIIYFLVR